MKLVTDQMDEREVTVLLRELKRVLRDQVDGDVVELGCYEGGSAVAMQQALKEQNYSKQLWLYDSFEGLPEKTAEDASVLGAEFEPGKLRASKARLTRNFVRARLRVPEIKRAWFWELDGDDLPDQIALAFLDGDYYESIMDSLRLAWPRLADGGVVLVDDYNNAKLPGVRKAIDEWVHVNGCSIRSDGGLVILERTTL